MQFFQLNSQFDDYNSVVAAKKDYEKSSNTLLSKIDSVLLPDPDSDWTKRFKYKRIGFICKAGPERKCQSKGLRKSSTIKKDCPVKVSYLQ